MAKKEHIVRHTAKEIKAMLARGESKTDWARAAATTDAEVAASIAADPEESILEFDWDNATIEMPQPKAVLNMRIDPYILKFFKRTGRGYQTRIQAVLRSYVEAHTERRT